MAKSEVCKSSRDLRGSLQSTFGFGEVLVWGWCASGRGKDGKEGWQREAPITNGCIAKLCTVYEFHCIAARVADSPTKA